MRHKTLWIACMAAFNICAGEPIGIIGGQGSAPYAALLYKDGLKTVEDLPPSGVTFRVSINSYGTGLIGGTNGVNAYAAFVSPDSSSTPIQGLIAPGEIYFTAINDSGLGLIGGGHADSNTPYAALVAKNGSVISLAVPASGLIYGVALDQSGDGIIGGAGPLNSAYAAITSQNGTVTQVQGLPTTGTIFWVSTNNSKTRLIGGADNTTIYAAFIAPDQTLAPISGLPSGQLYSVGINAKGNGIMGGQSLNLPYAALVNSNGTVKTLTGLPTTPGIIYNATINTSGTGLLAGFSDDGPYGTFVTPNGSLIPLKGLPTGTGFLDGAALHASGIALVGGTSFGKPFAALAAPNGTLTFLNGLPANGEINSTAFSLLDALVPKSVGLFDSYANTQFTLTDALTKHCIIHHRSYFQDPCMDDTRFSLWTSFVGNYTHEKSHHSLPGFSNKIGGVLLGLDYNAFEDLVFGGALAYAKNCVHFRKSQGCGRINHELGVLYASLDKPYFYVNAALWGGAFQTSLKRASILDITSKAKPKGYSLTPHLEVSSPFLVNECSKIMIDPFIALDFANSWQHCYREHGSSGFNIRLNNQYAAIFRTELGVRLYETVNCGFGRLIFEEKLSYVNRTPTKKGKGTANFIGAFSKFDVVTCNPYSENLGVAEIHIECIPACLKDTYASFDYQGEFGARFWSHMLTLSAGINF